MELSLRSLTSNPVSTVTRTRPEVDIWGLLNSTVFPKPDLTPVSRDVCNLLVTIEYDPPVRQADATAIRGGATIAPAPSAPGCSTTSKTLPYTLSVRAGNATAPLDYYRGEVARTLLFELVKRFMAENSRPAR